MENDLFEVRCLGKTFLSAEDTHLHIQIAETVDV